MCLTGSLPIKGQPYELSEHYPMQGFWNMFHRLRHPPICEVNRPLIIVENTHQIVNRLKINYPNGARWEGDLAVFRVQGELAYFSSVYGP